MGPKRNTLRETMIWTPQKYIFRDVWNRPQKNTE